MTLLLFDHVLVWSAAEPDAPAVTRGRAIILPWPGAAASDFSFMAGGCDAGGMDPRIDVRGEHLLGIARTMVERDSLSPVLVVRLVSGFEEWRLAVAKHLGIRAAQATDPYNVQVGRGDFPRRSVAISSMRLAVPPRVIR